jgi:hypothetical protein
LPATYAAPEEFGNAVLRHWNVNFIGPTSSCFVHRACFAEHGDFSPEIVTVPDLECWLRLGSREGLSIVPEPLVTFRVHDQSVSARLRQTGNDYRYGLEPLLLLMKLAFAPGYSTLRECAARLARPWDVPAMVRDAALKARWTAIDRRFHQRDGSALHEWNAFCRSHPEIRRVLRDADRAEGAWPTFKLFLKARIPPVTFR